jgi:hypothetical protein
LILQSQTGVETESVMKKLAVLLVLAAACHAAPPTPGAVQPAGAPLAAGTVGGAASPRAAVASFLGAVHAEDLQALASVWGTAAGPARNTIPRDELEKRELIMMCFLRHDRYRLTSDAESTGGQRRIEVEVTLQDITRSTSFITVPGAGGRWYVQSFDMEAVREICAKK